MTRERMQRAAELVAQAEPFRWDHRHEPKRYAVARRYWERRDPDLARHVFGVPTSEAGSATP